MSDREPADLANQLKAIIDTVVDGIIAIDSRGAIRSFNPAAERIFGYRAEEVIGENVSLLMPEPDRSRHDAYVARYLTTGERRIIGIGREVEGLRKDGSRFPLELAVSEMRVGGEQWFTGITRDISDRKRAEADLQRLSSHLEETVAARTAQLRQSEERYRSVTETAADAFLVSDAEGRVISWNHAAQSMFGHSREEMLGQSLTAIIPKRYRAPHRRSMERLRHGGVSRLIGRTIDLHGLHKDGSEFPIDLSLGSWRSGDETYFSGIIRDTTERRRLEEALRTSEEHYRQLVEGASEVFYRVTTPDDPLRGKLEFVSQRVWDLTGHPPEEFIRDPELWVKSVHPDDLPALAESTRAALSGLKSTIRVYRIQNVDGKYRWIEDEVTPVVDAQGSAIGYTGVARDITERRHLEAQLQQSQRMESVGRLAGGVAHDFNNLLTIILGTIHCVLANRTEEYPLYADLQEVRRAGERAAGLTRQLLAFSRRQILQPKVLNLNIVLEEMLSMLRRLLGEDITVAFVPGNDLGSVKADPGQIEQVIVNLAVNARDVMPTGGTLTIETQDVLLDEAYAAEHPPVQPGPHVMLAVSDTGFGMDEATCRQIFEPFFTTKAQGKGTGLGLSTVYGIVKQSSGSICVSSEIGHGTAFKVYLPRAEGTVHTNRVVPAAGRHGGGIETILVVEDDEGICRLATRMLGSAGYTVLAATNSEEVLRLLERHERPVHLMLTDVVMPGLSGRDLANRVTARYPAVKVIFTSGYTDDAIAHHGVLDEGTDFLSKPYTGVELTRKVREVLDA